MIRLQLALDDPADLDIVGRLAPLLDIVEVGTPLLKRNGIGAIRDVRSICDDIPILADTKTVDGARAEAEAVFDAGASLMTVLASADQATLATSVAVARSYGATVVFDTLLDPRINQAPMLELQEHPLVLLHSPADRRGVGDDAAGLVPLIPEWKRSGFLIAVAGGINRSNIAAIRSARPDLIIVGQSVTRALNPIEELKWIRARIDTPAG